MNNFLQMMFSLLLAFLLTLIPLPDVAQWGRPCVILLVLIYWSMTAPHQVGVGIAWLSGIIADLLLGSLMGEHAIAYTMVIYIVSKLSIRLKMSPPLQQGLSIFGFVNFYLIIIYSIQVFNNNPPTSPYFWVASVTSLLFWPFIYFFLRESSRWFRFA